MTRLPVDSWDVLPRLDIPPYTVNTICPVTGDASGLEDHHIFRRSFTALSKEDNDALYWVEYRAAVDSDETYVVKNRVALAPEAHLRVTTNRAFLKYQGADLYYVEGGPDGKLVEKKLNLDLHLMADGEKVTKRRRKANASTPEERKQRKSYSVWTPQGEQNVIPELLELATEKLAPEMNWQEDVPAYYVIVAALTLVIQS